MKQPELSNSSRAGRKSNASIFTCTPAQIRRMRNISVEARLPIETVFSDVVDAGLNIAPEMYESLINYRKSLKEISNEQGSNGAIPEARQSADERGEVSDGEQVGTPLFPEVARILGDGSEEGSGESFDGATSYGGGEVASYRHEL